MSFRILVLEGDSHPRSHTDHHRQIIRARGWKRLARLNAGGVLGRSALTWRGLVGGEVEQGKRAVGMGIRVDEPFIVLREMSSPLLSSITNGNPLSDSTNNQPPSLPYRAEEIGVRSLDAARDFRGE